MHQDQTLATSHESDFRTTFTSPSEIPNAVFLQNISGHSQSIS